MCLLQAAKVRFSPGSKLQTSSQFWEGVLGQSAHRCLPHAPTFLSISEIEEKGVRMKLTVIDTPGFGDHINNENW